MNDWKSKPDSYWKETLTAEQYRVCRKHGTERAFTGAYWDTKDPGAYRCVCCDALLFRSEEKFDSGTGWPSFWEAAEPGALELRSDNTFFMRRTEVLCARCSAHLGHVFEDGPAPTGKRYCMNSVALKFDPAK